MFRGITTIDKAARPHVESRSFLVALSKTIEGKRSASIQVCFPGSYKTRVPFASREHVSDMCLR